MPSVRVRIHYLILCCLTGLLNTATPVFAQTPDPPDSTLTKSDRPQDGIPDIQSAESKGTHTDVKPIEESRTAPPVEAAPFRTPLSVHTDPFDYSTLKPADYDLRAARTTESIKLDGVLSEEAWQWAEPAINFYQLQPAEGFPATQPTEVRVLYDDENLYVGFVCYDDQPDVISALDMTRDARIAFSNDMVQVVIAPLEGGREAYTFQTNPNGARSDSFVSQEGANFDTDWNGNWNAAGKIHDYGWSAEFMIPFFVLRFPNKAEQAWSINFGRRLQRIREDSYWVPLSLADGDRALYRFGKGGRLVGLQNIRPGGKVQVLPFSVLGTQGTRGNTNGPIGPTRIADTHFNHDLQRQAGGDVIWSITSGITMNATINPDFAQVEADDQVVNLSRFEFRFDEKRPFFLERSDIFSLSRRSNRGGPPRPSNIPQVFFSRRIGRQLPDGSAIPIDMGMRITGKVNKTTIGYLNVQTREKSYPTTDVENDTVVTTIETEPMTNWQAFRVSQDISTRSSIGLIATFKEPDPGLSDKLVLPIPRYAGANYNRVLAFDATVASMRTQHEFQFVGGRSFTDTLSASGQETVWYAAQRWRNRWMNYQVSYSDIGDNFIAQSGFIPQTNIRAINGLLEFSPFLRKYGIRSVNSSLGVNYTALRDERFFDPNRWSINEDLFFETEQGTWLGGGVSRSFDTLTGSSNRRIAGVHFAPGQYTFNQAFFAFFTNSAKRLSGNGFLTIGDFYSAKFRSVSLEGRYAPNAHLSFNPGVSWNRLERADRTGLAADEYDFNNRIIPRIRFNYSFTPNFQITSYVQLNADKRRAQDDFHLNTVAMNFLVAYRSPFGHSFFLAFNQFYDDALGTGSTFGSFDRTPLRSRDQTVVAKVAYLFNL